MENMDMVDKLIPTGGDKLLALLWATQKSGDCFSPAKIAGSRKERARSQ
jgi:hypothetical protein